MDNVVQSTAKFASNLRVKGVLCAISEPTTCKVRALNARVTAWSIIKGSRCQSLRTGIAVAAATPGEQTKFDGIAFQVVHEICPFNSLPCFLVHGVIARRLHVNKSEYVYLLMVIEV